jgi:hypothetical protein
MIRQKPYTPAFLFLQGNLLIQPDAHETQGLRFQLLGLGILLGFDICYLPPPHRGSTF